MLLASILIAVLVSSLVTYLILRPKLKQTQELDQQVIKENEQQVARKEQLYKELNNLREQCEVQTQNLTNLSNSFDEQVSLIEFGCAQAAVSAEAKMGNKLEAAALREREKYQKAVQEAQQEYKEVLTDLAIQVSEKNSSITELEGTLEQLKKKVLAITEQNKRIYEEAEAQKFYQLQITPDNLEEVQKLREIGKILRDPTPLNKMIWTYYFRNLFTDLSGRVIGGDGKSGIYMITNLTNGMSYIGQARDLKDRWSSHIKAGLGAETPSRNKLYPAMLAIGVENFSFEVLEFCSVAELNEREKFYIEFYDTVNFGYNITRGGS